MKKIHIVNKSQRKNLVLATLVIIVFVMGALGGFPVISASLTTPPGHGITIEQLLPKEEAPSLSVVKHSDKNQTDLGDSFTITIRIYNYSNKTAFNVTVTEPAFPPWAFTTLGRPSEYHYDRIEPGTEQVITYVLVSKTVGNFTLESTQVTYYDSRDVTVQRKFTAVSNILDLTVLPSGSSVTEKFQALYEAFVLLLLLIVVFGVLRIFSYRYYLKREKSGAKSS